MKPFHSKILVNEDIWPTSSKREVTGLARLSIGLNSRTLCSDSDGLEEKVSQGFWFIYICGKGSVAEGLFLVSKVKYCLSPFRNMNTFS